MKFVDTRNKSIIRTPSEAILSGPAPDGGLYMPDDMEKLSFPMEKLTEMSDRDIAKTILGSMFDDFSSEEIAIITDSSYKTSFGDALASLKAAAGVYFTELYHGPTCAFKDVALSALPHLMLAAKKKLGVKDEIMILTATSGDTGGAALYGFCDVPETKILVFYPDSGISDVQRRQMVCCKGKNTCVCAVYGNFDDAQSGVKNALRDIVPSSGVRLSSANSINIGRLAPQITYYFSSYRDLITSGAIKYGEKVDFVVPTGNFGDILAGFFALKAGLPVGKLVCASNENNVLSDFFGTGVYDRRREFRKTSSPSMDILVSSNLERLIYYYCGDEMTSALMEMLRKDGIFSLDRNVTDKIGETFSAGFATEAACRAAIKEVFAKDGYLIDPHTAVAYAVKQKLPQSGRKTVIIATASPYKFSGSVLSSLGHHAFSDEFLNLTALETLTGIPIPDNLKKLKDELRIHYDSVDKNGIVGFSEKKAGESIWKK